MDLMSHLTGFGYASVLLFHIPLGTSSYVCPELERMIYIDLITFHLSSIFVFD